MLPTSEAYRQEIDADERTILPFAEIRLIDPDIVYGGASGSEWTRYSSPEQLYDMDTEPGRRLATLEHNYWKLDGTFVIAPDGPEEPQAGIVLNELSDENGVFENEPWVQINVSNLDVLQAATIFFTGRENDGYPVDLTFALYSGATVAYSMRITDNAEPSIRFENFTAYNLTAARVTFHTWSLPYRRPRILEIMLGIYEQWNASNMDAVDVLQQTDFTNLTVSYGTARLTVDNDNRRFNPRAKNSIFESIEDRQGIPISYGILLPDGAIEKIPVGIYFQTEGGWKTGGVDETFTFNLVSIVGLISNRVPTLPGALPTTLSGWVALIVSTLGGNFTDYYIVDESLASFPLVAIREEIENMNCGDILRYACMAAGACYGDDPETGYLTITPIPEKTGTYIGLNSLFAYPDESANDELADITFRLDNDEDYTVIGTRSTSAKSQKVQNPFIHTQADANRAARNIISFYGGSKFVLRGRGDMSCEIGDVDIFETMFEENVSARRYKQQLKISNGVMMETPSYHIQPAGQKIYTNRVEFTENGAWTAPAGVTKLRIILVGQGEVGESGENGTWEASGKAGAGGVGGKVFIADIVINALQTLNISIGAVSVCGAYTSENGVRYNTGYGDVFSGKVYGLPGTTGVEQSRVVQRGVDGERGTGNGGQGGSGGYQGVRGWHNGSWIIKSFPVDGGSGGAGGTGAVIIYYDEV